MIAFLDGEFLKEPFHGSGDFDDGGVHLAEAVEVGIAGGAWGGGGLVEFFGGDAAFLGEVGDEGCDGAAERAVDEIADEVAEERAAGNAGGVLEDAPPPTFLRER